MRQSLSKKEKDNVLRVIKFESKKGRTYTRFSHMTVIGIFDNQLKALIDFLGSLYIDVMYREKWIDIGDKGFEMHPYDIVIDWSSREMIKATDKI